jgi:hypothetical protein
MINIDSLMVGENASVIELYGKYVQIISHDFENSLIAVYDHECNEPLEFYKDRFNPIPLTPDVLERLGFSKTGALLNLYMQGDLLLRFNQGSWYLFSFEDNGITLQNPPTHVHELQNLVLALTGEPLDVSGLLKDNSHE